MLAHFVLGLIHILGVPVGPVFVNGRFELAHLLAGGIEFQLGNALDVDKVIRLLRRRVKKIHLWHLVGLKSHLQLLIGEVEPELGGAHRIDGVEGCHAMVGLVPAFIPLARIDAQ